MTNFLIQQKVPISATVAFVIFVKMMYSRKKTPMIKDISYFNSLSNINTSLQKPKSVTVIDKKGLCKKLKTQEIEKKHGFQWREDIFIRSDSSYFSTVKSLFLNHQSPQITWSSAAISASVSVKFEDYFHDIEQSNNKMALFDMGDLGFGVVANDELREESFIGFYAGEVAPYEQNSRIYSWGAEIGKRCISIDAQRFGNMTRFIPHLPNANHLKKENLPGIELEKVATANLKILKPSINDMSFIVFQAQKTIQPRELIGYSYGSGYWSGRCFWLLEKNGKKIAQVQYTNPNSDIILVNKIK